MKLEPATVLSIDDRLNRNDHWHKFTSKIINVSDRKQVPGYSIDLPGVTIMVKYVNMTDISSRPLIRAKSADLKDDKSTPIHATGATAANANAHTISSVSMEHVTRSLSSTNGSAATIDSDCIAVMELFFFAYRDFTGEPDAILAEYKLGRAHHRVLHFVNRNPGLRVADLLDLLKVTKQSLSRVLKALVDQGWVEQISGIDDRRERRLYLTEPGSILANRLAQLQIERIKHALQNTGDGDHDTIQKFLAQMIGPAKKVPIGEIRSQELTGKSKA